MLRFFKIIMVFVFLLNFESLDAMNIKKNYSEKHLIDLNNWLPDTFEELRAMKENDLYKMSVEKYHYHQDKSNFYTKKELKEIEKYVDIVKVNQYFVERLNKERAKMGLSSNIQLDETLIKIAKIRSDEMASQSKISHKRPNKKDYWTVFEETDKSLLERASFENILRTSIASEAQMVSEKFIANHFYDLWKESKEHWLGMTDKDLKIIGVSFSFGFSNDKNFLSQMNYGVMIGVL